MRLRILLLAGCALFAQTAFAEENLIGKNQQSELEISIYNNNLALVKDFRKAELKQGENNIAFEGVAAMIKPETALLAAPGVKVLEQNYDYDLLSTANIIDKSVGETVKTVLLNPETGENVFDSAEIVSAAYGQPLLKFSYGMEAVFPGRLVFDRLPASLRNEPTLVAKVMSEKAGAADMSLAYLTNGIGWKTNYVAKVSSPEKLDLTGWVTINNESGIDYNNARVQLIAGDVNQVTTGGGVARPVLMMAKAVRSANDSVVAESGSAAPMSLSGYHLYNLPLKTDIKDKQTKQISLLEKNGAAYKKIAELVSPLYFNYNSPAEFKQQHPQMIFYLKNDEASGLGLPLPAGVIRFYENDADGNMQFIGEDRIDHVAKGGEMRLNLGRYFNVFVSGRVADITKLAEEKTKQPEDACYTLTSTYAYDAEVTFNNANAYPQEVVFKQNLAGDARVENESLAGVKKDAGTYAWTVNVPAEGEQKLTFRVVLPSKSRVCR